MSLSIPITRAPSPAKRLTVSDPTNPDEPVTMIVRIKSKQPLLLSNHIGPWFFNKICCLTNSVFLQMQMAR
jgi:hypothetical protein